MTFLMFTSTTIACGTVYFLGNNQSLVRLFIGCFLGNAFIMGFWGFFNEKYIGETLPTCSKKAVASSVTGALGTGVAGYVMGLYVILLVNIVPAACDVFLNR
jgi:predicted membrane protein